MPQPNVRGQLVSGPLQNVSTAYRNNAFIADKIYPVLDCISPDAKIGKYLKGAWFRDEAALRAPGTRAVRGGYKVTTDSITCLEYAFAKEVTDDDRRLSGLVNTPPLKPVTDAVRFCTEKIMLQREKAVATAILAATWSGSSTGEDAEGGWAAGSGNTFIADVEGAIDTIEKNTGFRPNCMWLSANTLKELKQESTVLDRIKYVQAGIITAQLIASLFDFEEVLIGGGVYSSDEETVAGTEFTAVRIWETTATKGAGMVFYRPPSIGLLTPCVGYLPRTPFLNGQYRSVKTWREEAEHQDVYEVAETYDIVQTGTDLGYLFKDTIST